MLKGSDLYKQTVESLKLFLVHLEKNITSLWNNKII